MTTRMLRVEGIIEGVKSPNGTPMEPVKSYSAIPITSVVSLSVLVSRNHTDQSVIESMALILSLLGGVALPIATVADTNSGTKVKSFQDYVKDVINRVCGTDEVVVIDIRTF